MVSPAPENKPANIPLEKVEEKPVNTPEKANPDLEMNQRLWLKSNIVNYNVIASLYIGGVNAWAEPVLIKVRDGKAISIEPTSESDKGKVEGYKEVDTIDKMFDALQRGLNEEAIVEVKYNKKFGYPEEMYINHFKKGSDQYMRMIIKRFEAIKTD